MAKYRVEIEEISYSYYDVEADSREDAMDNVNLNDNPVEESGVVSASALDASIVEE
jgi:hypothetical protein